MVINKSKGTVDKILPISFFKGGTSVLADAFLVKGNLNIKEMHFAFAYGSFLQLLDDLLYTGNDNGCNGAKSWADIPQAL
jgi:hypothetical protein